MSTVENALCNLPVNVNKQLIIEVLKKEEVIFSSLNINKIFASHFFSSLYLFEANCSNNKNLKLYVKCLLEDSSKSESLRAPLQFKNEIVLYKTIIPGFQEFQRKKFPEDSRPPLRVPECYAAVGNGESDTVILKDMCTSGFVLLDPLKSMNMSEISLALRKLGRFHGFSLAMKIESPDEFKNMIGQLVQPIYGSPQYEDVFRDLFSISLESVRYMMNDIYEEESIYLKKYDEFIKTATDLLPIQAVTDPSNEPYNVITHGDISISNMLFHYDKDGKDPDDICFLDFQQVRYGSPAIDLWRFLYVIVDKATRDQHQEYLLHCYHDGLSETLHQFDLNHEYLFPFSELERQLRKCSAFVVIITIFTLPIALDKKEDKQHTDDKTDVKNFLTKRYLEMSTECRRRVFETIEEFVEKGYMDVGKQQ